VAKEVHDFVNSDSIKLLNSSPYYAQIWHRISRHGATKVTPFELVYGQEAVLPVEVNLGAYRLAKQNDLSVGTYHALMMDNIDEVTDKHLEALEAIEKDKR
jgi:hypothetical protein